MKKIKIFALLVAVISIFLCIGCSTPDDNSSGHAPQTDLQLLRIETTGVNSEEPGYRPVSVAKSTSSRAVTLLSTKNASEQAVITVNTKSTDNKVEKLESDGVNLVAVVKNENRASFIDMVVYNSQTDKTVVYNEGNGAYQCRSETVYEDDMWVTNITFYVNVELSIDDFYFEIKEIKFLRNSTDAQVDLNNETVRKKTFAFSDEYLTNAWLNKNFNMKSGMFYVRIEKLHLESKTVKIYCDTKNKEYGGSYADYEFDVSQDIPSILELEYYQNGEVKTADFKVLDAFINIDDKISKIVINDSINFHVSIVAGIVEYAEGSKKCALHVNSDGGYLLIPSTCNEIIYEYVGFCRNLVYNGTMDEFKKIKGVDEVVLRFYYIECSDGIIHESVDNSEEEKKEF